jgi:hypothetical protein
MIKRSLKLRNVVAIAICLAGFSANSVLAQDFNYTAPDGVNYTFSLYLQNQEYKASIKQIHSIPASVIKWVIPETVTNNSTVYKVVNISSGAWGNPVIYPISTVEEIVLPKYMTGIDSYLGSYYGAIAMFPNVRKLTLGEEWRSAGTGTFSFNTLDSLVFLGDKMRDVYGKIYFTWTRFNNCPATAKVIVPCGTLADFLVSFNGSPNNTWTAANFYEAECLNILTVLSSDNNLGNAWSMNGGTIITSTPGNTSANCSGTATLVAIPQGGKVFVGWNDGNVTNPRTVTVSSDTTFTANFATCENVGIKSVNAESPLKVYPNPTNNTLNVELERFVNNGTLTLFDMSGKLVLSQSVNGNSTQINLSALTAGNYILRLVENGTASAGVQVIKQ